jgi:hypothetical protein
MHDGGARLERAERRVEASGPRRPVLENGRLALEAQVANSVGLIGREGTGY